MLMCSSSVGNSATSPKLKWSFLKVNQINIRPRKLPDFIILSKYYFLLWESVMILNFHLANGLGLSPSPSHMIELRAFYKPSRQNP